MATIIILFVLMGMLISIVIWSIRNGIAPMPSSPKAIRAILSLLPENLEGKIVELGSGWGTLAIAVAKRKSQNQVIGYESSPIPYGFSKILCFFSQASNLQIFKEDFYNIYLKDSQLIICYLYPDAMRRLKTKFNQELNPNTFIISNTFAIPGWQPIQIVEVKDIYSTRIYIYKV